MNKLTAIALGILIFLFLFYNRQPGLNISLFVLCVWMITCFVKKPRKPDTTFWILSASMWISALSWAWYGDTLSFFAMFFSCIVTVFYLRFPALNIVTHPFLLGLNLFTFPGRIFFIKHWVPSSLFRLGLQKWIATIAIPIFFFVIFAFVYSTGSDVISNFFTGIFDFDFSQTFWLSVLAFFIMFNLLVVWVPRILIQWNGELRDDYDNNQQRSVLPIFRVDKDLEKTSGLITLVLLNILLIVFIISYNYEQFFTVADSSTLSSEVHDRVTTIIVSILLAIGLILFYFRSKLENGKRSGRLVTLAGLWLLLNGILVASAIIKNTEYISSFGLTFKRISVYIFLSLCLTGLALAWYKIRFEKTNHFLINRMTWVLYFTIIVSAPINFSWLVTKYNTEHQKSPDSEYLKYLDYNKELLLSKYGNEPEWEEFFAENKRRMDREKKKPFLSSHLYYKAFVK